MWDDYYTKVINCNNQLYQVYNDADAAWVSCFNIAPIINESVTSPNMQTYSPQFQKMLAAYNKQIYSFY